IHDLYLRAHIISGEKDDDTKEPRKRKRSPQLWPDNALVWDTETALDLEQELNFGVWRFCVLRGEHYVSVQEGIFYSDGLDSSDIQTILNYKKNLTADQSGGDGGGELAVFSRTEFVERIFWESVRAGALILGFNMPFDISRIAVQWGIAHNGGFS